MVILEIVGGILTGGTGDRYVCGERETVTIGRREDQTIRFPSDKVSRIHCEVDIHLPDVTVRDCNSKNGTYLYDRRRGMLEIVTSETPRALHDGDEILLGQGENCYKLNCHITDAAEATAPACGGLNAAYNGLIDHFSERWNRRKTAETLQVDNYYLTRVLGEGGMCQVWKGMDVINNWFALKILQSENRTNKYIENAFRREIDICSKLSHEHVIRTFGGRQVGSVFYIVMEYCKGGSVADLIGPNGEPLSLELATWIILQVLDGLAYVHGEGLVHRDIKPGNILLSDSSDHPRAVVADFGTAKLVHSLGLTGNHTIGTTSYMPRQQAQNARDVGQEVDVWAAAASYYTMLTGVPPKREEGLHPWEEIDPLRDAVPIRERGVVDIPDKLAEVIDSALIDNPEIRCRSAKELRRNIFEALAGAEGLL